MSIKYANPKTYGAIFQKLVNGYRKVKGKEPTGLDLIKIKLEAADQVKQSEKIIKFPEEKITPFYEERPSKGPQADIKSFPKKQTNQPTSLESINKLVKDLQDIYEKSPTLTEIMGVSNKYPKKEGIVKITTDYLKTKDEKGIMDEVKKIIDKKGSYADLSEEERRRILGEAQDLLDNPKKTAEEIIDEGDFDPSGMMNGGRIGYSVGAGKKGVQGLLNLVKNKFGKKSITTADKVARPEKAVVKDLFDEFNKRLKEKDIKKQSKETYERLKKEEPEIMAEFDEMWEDPEKFAPNKDRLLTDDEIKEYEEVLGDSETWMTKGTLGEADEAIKRQMDYEKQMYAEYRADKQARKELEQAYKEIDFRMTGEDTKYEANELADMLSEIRYKTEYSDLPQKTQLDLYDEAYDYLMEVKRDAANFKGATNIKTGKNIVTGEQELPLDPTTGKPRKLNATGGRVGFAQGSDPKSYDVPTESPLKISGNFSKSKKSEILDYVASLEIPISEKIKLIGELTGVNSSFKDEYGKYKYQDLMKSVGLNYNEGGEGLSAAFRHNVDTGENDAYFQYKMPFATGGRIGFSVGGIDKVRRALLKMFGGAAATGVAVKTGLGGLLKGGEKAKDVVKTAETVKTAANTPPNYVFDLIKIIKAKGKDITKQAGTIERETVTSYRGVELYETPNGVVIRAEGKTPYEGGKEIQLSLNKTTDVVDEGKKTQKQVSKVEYEEATVRPDPEGKMKDVDFYVDETDHAELKRIVDEEKGFKSGGLAYMLGE